MGRSDWDPDWDRIQEIYKSASRLPPAERGKFVSSACQYDPALMSEVNSLLAARTADAAAVDKLVGTTIDERYFVERELGQGAIGKVYRALDRRLDNRVRAMLERSVSKSSSKRLTVVGVVLASLALLSFGFYKSCFGPTDTSPSHSFDYWLIVQRTHDGKDYQEPLKTFGEETFDNGDKFQLNVSSDRPGYLYIFNEGPPEPDNISFKIIYPNLLTNHGSATVGANQPVQSEWITFRGPPGAENFWIVWSVSPVNELEFAKTKAFKDPKGELTDGNLVAVKEFLRARQSKTTVRRYKASQTATVRGATDMLITFVEFKHR